MIPQLTLRLGENSGGVNFRLRILKDFSDLLGSGSKPFLKRGPDLGPAKGHHRG